MTTMRKFPGYTCCNRRLLVHIPPQRGHESRFHGACLRGERLLGPSSFQAPTAAALPGLGATVTSHPGDILKGASQHELWVGRTSTSAVLTHLLHNVREIRGRSSSGVRKSIYLQVGRFSEPLSGKWYVRHLFLSFSVSCFLQCCGIALFPVSRHPALRERCRMFPVTKRRLYTSCQRARHSTRLILKTSPRNHYLLRKYSRYSASTSLLRVCLSIVDGWVLYIFSQSQSLGLADPEMPEVIEHAYPFSPWLVLLL